MMVQLGICWYRDPRSEQLIYIVSLEAKGSYLQLWTDHYIVSLEAPQLWTDHYIVSLEVYSSSELIIYIVSLEA